MSGSVELGPKGLVVRRLERSAFGGSAGRGDGLEGFPDAAGCVSPLRAVSVWN
jgi:hypothetical protein